MITHSTHSQHKIANGANSIGNGGTSLTLTNNTWKYIDFPYTVTVNTVIELEFSSTSEGEIHGIGFENDNSLTSSFYFKIYGTQNYGITILTIILAEQQHMLLL